MEKICDAAKYVRSKNAGPFWVTIDIFCDTDAAYEKISGSKQLSTAAIAEIYHVQKDDVEIYHLPDLKVIKISLPREVPQGAPGERDMHAGQQYLQLMDLAI